MRIRRNKTQIAFTLIELLVVITIIAVLAAFLFPIIGSIRQRSKQTISLNNLKQWGVALNRSLGDYNGHTPSDGQGSTSIKLTETDAWFNRLPPYIDEKPLSDPYYVTNPPKPGDRSVWVNPVVPKEGGTIYGSIFINPPQKFLFCYAINHYLSNAAERTQPLSRIERPAATVFMAEKNDNFATCSPTKIKAYFGPGNPNSDKNNAAHFLFCDGHVELIKRSVFTDPSATDNVTLDPNFTYIPFYKATSS